MSALIEALILARETRTPLGDTSGMLPATIKEAYQLQALHTERLLPRLGGSRIGYKLGATSPATLQAFGFETPFSGPILSSWTHPSPATLARDAFFVCAIEAEIAFRIGRDLTDPLPISRDRLCDAIEAAFPVIEIADTRLLNPRGGPPAAIVTDLGLAGALITGAEHEGWREIDLPSLAVELEVNGQVTASGSGAMVLGDPVACLLGFAEERASAGAPLRAGDLVSTGTCTPPYPAKAGDRLVARFGPFGSVELVLE